MAHAEPAVQKASMTLTITPQEALYLLLTPKASRTQVGRAIVAALTTEDPHLADVALGSKLLPGESLYKAAERMSQALRPHKWARPEYVAAALCRQFIHPTDSSASFTIDGPVARDLGLLPCRYERLDRVPGFYAAWDKFLTVVSDAWECMGPAQEAARG